MALMLVGVAMGAGCTAPTASTAPAPAGPNPVAAPVLPPVGEVVVSGAVAKTGPITVAQLAAMPSQTASVEFGSSKGTEHHTEIGTPLVGVIDQAGLNVVVGRHNDQLCFGVLVVGADGYQALISYGEMAPAFGNSGALLAITEDGHPLARPRLVAPRDVKGGRYVTDVVALHVVRLTARSRS